MDASDHCHHHGHHHEQSSQMSLEEKAVKLLEHWIAHNDDHGANYGQWAAKLRRHGHVEAAEALEQVGQLTARISQLFRQAKDNLDRTGN